MGDKERDVIIGGAQFYDPEDLIGKTVIVVANLEPKKMAGVESNAMLLAADIDDKPFLSPNNSSHIQGHKIVLVIYYLEENSYSAPRNSMILIMAMTMKYYLVLINLV